MRGAAVQDQVHGIAQLRQDFARVSGLGISGAVGRGGRQRPDPTGKSRGAW